MTISLRHRDRVTWLTAAPLWPLETAGAGVSARLSEPAILRFAGDDFMAQATGTLAERPDDLSRFVARQESWQAEAAGWQAVPGSAPLTLYQPIHNRFYLAVATLVCQRPGLPDRGLNRVSGDRVAMLLRRLVARPGVVFDPSNPAARAEQAWVGDVQSGRWVTLADPALPGAGEERLPMFPLPYRDGDRSRRLHAAVIPVARANGYATAPGETAARASAADSVADPLGDPRVAELGEGVLGGLAMLAAVTTPPGLSGDALSAQRRQTRSALVLALLDIGAFLTRERPDIAAVLRGGSSSALSLADLALVGRLTGTALAGGYTAAQAIVRALDREAALAAGDHADSLVQAVLGTLPNFAAIAAFANGLRNGPPALIDLIRPTLTDPRAARVRDAAAQAAQAVAASAAFGDGEEAALALLAELLILDTLLAVEVPDLAAALPGGPAPSAADADLFAAFGASLAAPMTWGDALAEARSHAPEILAGTAAATDLVRLDPDAGQIAAAAAAFFGGLEAALTPSLAARPLPAAPPAAVTAGDDTPDPVYVLRTIHERDACKGIHPPTLSAPSRPLRLAGFFDANAPVRPLSIEMPARTSIADFRKAPRNVTIRLSRELRSQISRVRNATLDEPLEDQLGGGSFDLGVICSLSIPIITICALILLMIIVQLLNIVFWWLPYFMFCFPVRRS